MLLIPCLLLRTVDGDLKFFIGDRSTDRVELLASNVTGELKTGWSPLSTVLTILKLGDTSTMSVKISDQGAMMIQWTQV